ncbi:hypothetical protein D3C72_2002400 [compost metagenome]
MHDANPGQRSLTQHHQVIGDQPWSVPQAGTGAIRALQVPVVITLRITPMQARQAGEVRWHRAFRQALDQFRCGHQVLGAARQYLHHQVTAFQRRHPHA